MNAPGVLAVLFLMCSAAAASVSVDLMNRRGRLMRGSPQRRPLLATTCLWAVCSFLTLVVGVLYGYAAVGS